MNSIRASLTTAALALAAFPLAPHIAGASSDPTPLSDAPRTVVVSGGGYFPVLIRLKNGELISVLRGGAPHVGIKGRLDLVSSSDQGKHWTPPRTVIDGPEDDRNPAFGQMANGDIVLAYAVLKGYDATGLKFRGPKRSDRTAEGVYVMRSSDNGKTWTEPEINPASHELQKQGGSLSPFGKLVQLKDGTALMSVYYDFSDERGHKDYVFRSHNNGKTWADPTLVAEHTNETALLALRDGTLLAALRSEKGAHLSITASNDGGRTWSAPVQVTRDMEHPADVIQLKNGDVFLAYGERNAPFGVEAKVSHDGGKTWDDQTKVVLAKDGSNVDCGYPSSVQLPNGKIVTMYYQVDNAKDTPASAKAKAIVWALPKK